MVTQAESAERGATALLEASYASMEGVAAPLEAPRRTPIRSLAKALSWRALGSLVTFLTVFALAKDAALAAAVVGVEIVVKIALYFFHEEAWKRSRFGIEKSDARQPSDEAGW
jgi:uncharacterized membrane protein